jgi:hypothetical protein
VHPLAAARRVVHECCCTQLLEDCTLRDAGVKVIAAGLMRKHAGSDTCGLRCLSLTNNYIHVRPDPASRPLAPRPLPAGLSAVQCSCDAAPRWQGEGAEYMAMAVSVNTTLTELHMDWNQLGPAGVAHLAGALGKNRALRTLNLEASDARDRGAEAMGAALTRNTVLSSLTLDTCNITPIGAVAIAARPPPLPPQRLGTP